MLRLLRFNRNIHYFDGTVEDILSEQLPLVNKKIPSILHFVWVGPRQPEPRVIKLLNDWKAITKMEIRLWGNQDLNTKEFSPEILEKINQSEKPAQKADIIRLAVLYKYGGVYLDTDMRPIRDILPLINYFAEADGIICHEEVFFIKLFPYMTNAFIACRPGSRLVGNALQLILSTDVTRKNIGVNFLTGPGLFGRSLNLGFEDEIIVCLPTPFFYPISWRRSRRVKLAELSPQAKSNCFAQHLWFKSW